MEKVALFSTSVHTSNAQRLWRHMSAIILCQIFRNRTSAQCTRPNLINVSVVLRIVAISQIGHFYNFFGNFCSWTWQFMWMFICYRCVVLTAQVCFHKKLQQKLETLCDKCVRTNSKWAMVGHTELMNGKFQFCDFGCLCSNTLCVFPCVGALRNLIAADDAPNSLAFHYSNILRQSWSSSFCP